MRCLVDGVRVPVCPVHQVLEEGDAEGMLQLLVGGTNHPLLYIEVAGEILKGCSKRDSCMSFLVWGFKP